MSEFAYLDGVFVDRRTVHLLIADGLVSGSAENGFHWTDDGAAWIADLIATAVEDRIRETA